MKYYVNWQEGVTLKQQIANIPPCTTIILKFSSIYKIDEIVEAMPSIPSYITSISFENFTLEDRVSAETAQLFASIPSFVKALDLSCNVLGRCIPTNELVNMFSKLPKSLISLELSKTHLGDKSDEELEKIFSSFPNSLQELSLNRSVLRVKVAVPALKSIPSSVHMLDLSDNLFYQSTKNINDAAAILSGIPKTVKTLNLSKNHFGLFSAEKFIAFISNLPPTVTSLNLSKNGIGIEKLFFMDYDPCPLSDAIAALPKSIESLDLSYNDFNKNSDEEIIKAFKNISHSIKRLIIKGCSFSENKRLNEIIDAIPHTVVDIICDEEAVNKLLSIRKVEIQSSEFKNKFPVQISSDMKHASPQTGYSPIAVPSIKHEPASVISAKLFKEKKSACENLTIENKEDNKEHDTSFFENDIKEVIAEISSYRIGRINRMNSGCFSFFCSSNQDEDAKSSAASKLIGLLKKTVPTPILTEAEIKIINDPKSKLAKAIKPLREKGGFPNLIQPEDRNQRIWSEVKALRKIYP